MKFIIKFIKSLKPLSQEELNERYLNQSTSLCDLEDRIRYLDNRESDKRRGFYGN